MQRALPFLWIYGQAPRLAKAGKASRDLPRTPTGDEAPHDQLTNAAAAAAKIDALVAPG
jgi:hypothetical protein